MKRWIAAATAVLMMITAGGCSEREKGEATGEVPLYQDGVYTARWEGESGEAASLELTVEKGVATVTNYAAPSDAPASFQETMKQELLENRAKMGDTNAYTMSLYHPGTYTVRQVTAGEEWVDYLVVEATGETLTVTDFDGKNQDGELKSQDQELIDQMRAAKLYGPNVFLGNIVKSYEEAGSLDKMEAVVGATLSTEEFKTMFSTAQRNAKYRLGEDVSIGEYVDGTYRAEMRDFEQGWKDYVVVTIQDNQVTIDEFDALNEKGEKKSQDTKFKETMIRALKRENLPETYPEKYNGEILASFEKSQGDVTAMDNIAGATVSTNNFKLLVGQILTYSARVGDTELLVVEPLE